MNKYISLNVHWPRCAATGESVSIWAAKMGQTDMASVTIHTIYTNKCHTCV